MVGLMARRRPRRRLVRVAVGLGLAIAPMALGIGSADADAAFTLRTSAQGVSLVAANPDFPFVSSYQVNAPTAIATLNNRGQGIAYSASPDPGLTIAELPVTLSAVLCDSIRANGFDPPGCDTVAKNVPAYPYAYANAGDPPQDKTLPAGHLHAEAKTTSTAADTTNGVDGAAAAVSTAHTRLDDSKALDGLADSAVDGLVLASYLKLSDIHAQATFHRTPSGKLTTTSEFDVGSITVRGQKFGFHNGSFVVPGSVVDIPVPAQQVFNLFKAVGVTATYLPAHKDSAGVTSAGLTLSYSIPGAPKGVVPPLPPLPGPVSVGVPHDATVVTYVLGLVSATGGYQTIPGIGGIPVGGTPTTYPSSPTGGNPPIASGSLPPTSSGSLPPTTSGGSAASGQQSAGAVPTSFTPLTGANIYLLFVVGALLVFVGASAVRYLGVRHSWNS